MLSLHNSETCLSVLQWGGNDCLVVPAVSRVLGPAPSVRSVSLETQCGEGALCLGTVPEQSLPLRAERCLLLSWLHDRGCSWRREHGGLGHLPGVTSVPISLASGLLPKPGTATWRGEVALWPSTTTNTESSSVVSELWQYAVIVLCYSALLAMFLRKKLLRGQLRKSSWVNSNQSHFNLTVMWCKRSLEDPVYPPTRETMY